MASNMTTTPEPETKSEPEPEHPSLFPEVMHQQAAFLLYGILIFVLFVIVIVLIVLFHLLKSKVKRAINKMEGSGNMKMGKGYDNGHVAA
ncbi:hypothetical protein AC249_AIPGENE3811 [Exaiptasia diaphana]|nr:hypothetical protein AC249_AIPGENE3811 [Exaiptasia diaphana]